MKPFEAYLATEVGCTSNTLEAVRHDIATFERFLEQRQKALDAFDHNDIDAFTAQGKLAGLSPATLKRRVSTVRMFLKFQALEGRAVSHILRNVLSPKVQRVLPNVLSRQQVLKLLKAAESPRDIAILEFLYGSGLRASELCALRLPDVSFASSHVRVIGKGRKERQVPVNGRTVVSIRAYLAVRQPAPGQDALFLTKDGMPLDRIDLWRIVKRAVRKSGLVQEISPHTLRHCFASHLLSGHEAVDFSQDGLPTVHLQSGGANIRVVQELLGHESVDTTMRYTHVDFGRLRRVHALLGR